MHMPTSFSNKLRMLVGPAGHTSYLLVLYSHQAMRTMLSGNHLVAPLHGLPHQLVVEAGTAP